MASWYTQEYQIEDLKRIVNRLNDAIDVCCNAKSIDNNQPDTYNESYPFATGYSKSAMRETQEDLQRVIDKIGAKDDWIKWLQYNPTFKG